MKPKTGTTQSRSTAPQTGRHDNTAFTTTHRHWANGLSRNKKTAENNQQNRFRTSQFVHVRMEKRVDNTQIVEKSVCLCFIKCFNIYFTMNKSYTFMEPVQLQFCNECGDVAIRLQTFVRAIPCYNLSWVIGHTYYVSWFSWSLKQIRDSTSMGSQTQTFSNSSVVLPINSIQCKLLTESYKQTTKMHTFNSVFNIYA